MVMWLFGLLRGVFSGGFTIETGEIESVHASFWKISKNTAPSGWTKISALASAGAVSDEARETVGVAMTGRNVRLHPSTPGGEIHAAI